MKSLLITLVLLFISIGLYPQKYIKGPAIPNTEYVWLDSETLEIAVLKLDKPQFVPLRNHSQWLKETLSASEEVDFELLDKSTDDIGQDHYRYQQTFRGYPVEGSQYIINKYKGLIFSINGKFTNIINTNPVKLNKTEAFNIAKEKIDIGKLGTDSNRPILIIFNYILCYKFDIYYPETQTSIYVYVNAETGKIVNKVREY